MKLFKFHQMCFTSPYFLSVLVSEDQKMCGWVFSCEQLTSPLAYEVVTTACNCVVVGINEDYIRVILQEKMHATPACNPSLRVWYRPETVILLQPSSAWQKQPMSQALYSCCFGKIRFSKTELLAALHIQT